MNWAAHHSSAAELPLAYETVYVNSIRRPQMNDALHTLLRTRSLNCLFQPIVDARDRSVLGYEALIRGPEGSLLHAPAALFASAESVGRVPELDRLCFELAAARKVALELPGRLFVNLTAQGLLSLGEHPERVAKTLETTGLKARQLVFELTEQAILDDYEAIRRALAQIGPLGASFAIDDLGTGYSGLRAWSELHPEFVKIDRYFISNVDSDSLKMEFVHAIIDLARAARSTVIAEGVETAAEARELVDAGVQLLQGFYIAQPAAEPQSKMSDTMIQRCPVNEQSSEGSTARDLVFPCLTISPDMLVPKVAELFHDNVEINAVAVVRDEKPIGIVRRLELLDLLSIPLRLELYLRKPISTLMDSNPLLIESDLRLEQVSRLVTRGYRERLQEQFIVTEQGKYVGLARMVDLLKLITQQQLQIARHSNPLTLLPGSVPIYDCVNRLLRRGKRFVLCHADLDHFKPYNDFYGYSKGDEALVLVSKILARNSSARIDFLGHVGGDDFVIAFRSPDWQLRLERVFAELKRSHAELYKPEHVRQGGIFATDRYGVQRLFPLLSISVAALLCEEIPDVNAEQLAYHLAPLKARAKMRQGSCIEIDDYANVVRAAALADDAPREVVGHSG
jgi:EAL domain-containing protein (putative c-di-GMP-specific phosphodiesterase class I)/GGDEF domain-containing protein